MDVLSTVVDVVSAVLALAGCLLTLLAAVGAVRFPDVLSRMHATTKAATLGLLLILLAALLQAPDWQSRSLIVLVGVFQLLTAPVAAHMIGRAAYRVEASCRDALVVDELAGALASDAASADLRTSPAGPSDPEAGPGEREAARGSGPGSGRSPNAAKRKGQGKGRRR